MAVVLDHSFSTARPIEEAYATILDPEQLIACVEGGRVLERTGPDSVKAEIVVRMGAMSLTFTGSVEVTERDPQAHSSRLEVRSREAGGQGYANATVEIALGEGGSGTIHTNAQITGKAASMGEGVMQGVLEALIADFAGKLAAL